MLRVAVLGAKGRMGAEVCRVVEAADDLELVAALDASDNDREIIRLQCEIEMTQQRTQVLRNVLLNAS